MLFLFVFSGTVPDTEEGTVVAKSRDLVTVRQEKYF
jgi:hypothetical protein